MARKPIIGPRMMEYYQAAKRNPGLTRYALIKIVNGGIGRRQEAGYNCIDRCIAAGMVKFEYRNGQKVVVPNLEWSE